MSEFDDFKMKPEVLTWEDVAGTLVAYTTRGMYTIRQKHYLSFKPVSGPEMKIGRFKDAKRRARIHYNEEA